MQVVLMAGGSGTRLRPLTCDLPKPMVTIINIPIIGHIVNLLKSHNLTELTVTLYYLPDIIQNYLKDGSDFGVDINYAIEKEIPLGTAGCVKNIQDWLKDTFLVISSDSLTDFDLQKAIEFHHDSHSVATIILKRVPNPLEYGIVITEEDGKILRFLEKPGPGEVFSDTINTGIYILDPMVLNLLPSGVEKDFSKDLFPELLRKKFPMYGYIAEGYWCDIGDLKTYKQAHSDALNRKIKLEIPYEEKHERIWIGEGSVVESSVLEAPLIIGNNCYIGAGVRIKKNTVLGDNVVVCEKASLKQPIIGNNVYIDQKVSLIGCIIGKNVTIRREAQVLEGAVIGDECFIGEKTTIKPNVRVWPNKNIEAGEIITESVIWGSGLKSSLFGELGVSGLINVDITPEIAVKFGAAYGATIGIGKSVAVSRDQTPAARFLSRAFISGVLSVGVNVANLEETAIPIARYQIPHLGVEGGIHIRLDPDDHEKISIEFIDTSGLNISPSVEKKIESTFIKEDFRRARIDELGELSFPARIKEKYNEGFLRQFHPFCTLKPLKIVVDYAYRIGTVILPTLLGKLGIETVVLNAYLSLNQSKISRQQLTAQLSEVVIALKADFGVLLDANGERFMLIDDKGNIIKNDRMLAFMIKLIMEDNPESGGIAVPVMASKIVENIAQKYNSTTIRTKSTSRALMEATAKHKVSIAGYNGKFIFPSFHNGFDSMFSTAKIATLIGKKGVKISDIVAEIPESHVEHELIPCFAGQKGKIMRILVQDNRKENIDLLDGLKIFSHDGWVLILPDSSKSAIHIYAEGESKEITENILKTYKFKVTEIINKRPE